MTENPIRIPLSTRVMPSIIAHDIKGVSPMIGPVDSVINANMITERQGEGQIDIEADPVTGHRIIKIDFGDLPMEKTLEAVEQIKKQLHGTLPVFQNGKQPT